ncbi:MAG: vanadium-dependent haloperoxidase [Pricia sp.]
MSKNKYLIFFGLLLFLGACTNDDNQVTEPVEQKTTGAYDAEVVTQWYDLIKTLTIETPGYTPPVAARAFGYTSIALYESVVPGMPDKVSLSGKLTDLNIDMKLEAGATYHWPTVANAALARMTGYFYANTSSERLTAIAALEDKFDVAFLTENGTEVHEVSVALGRDVANGILAWSETDGAKDAQFNNFPEDYVPPSGEQFWVPTAPNFQSALQPYWGSNRPFLMENIANQTLPANPPPFSTEEGSVCYQRALEVYKVVNELTPEQRDIAEFWSDDPITTATPPGHSISILNQLIKQNDSRLDLAAEAFAKLGIGISDAFVSCWKVKYETLYQRPITYINNNIDPDWRPVLGTPPFPEYTSGHSVQSGALAEIMTSFFGEDYQFTDRTHENRKDINGTPRIFDNFYAMAEEAAISRLYGGIHFQEAISLGLDQGYEIGRNVNALDLSK